MAKSLGEIIFILLTTMIHPFLRSREKNRKETLRPQFRLTLVTNVKHTVGSRKNPTSFQLEWHLIKLSDSGKINSGGGWHMEGLICVN